jgi:putative ABC transport system permease protein
MGVGVLVIGLASIIIGEGVFGKRTFKNWMISVLLGALLYYLIIVIAIQLGLPSHYQKLLYALLILIVLAVPRLRKLILKGGKNHANA